MRNTAKIRGWMFENKIRYVDIQRSLKQMHIHQVWGTINGTRNDRRVLRWLKEHKCPVRYLDLPPDMIDAA